MGFYSVVLAGLDGAYEWRGVSRLNFVGDCLESSYQTMACVFSRFYLLFHRILSCVAKGIAEKAAVRADCCRYFGKV